MNTEFLVGYFNAFGGFAVMISIVLNILIALSGILPSFFVTSANILFFGPINGFLISWLGETTGAILSFYLYRKGFRGFAQKMGERYPLLRSLLAAQGIAAGLLVLQGRLIPFIPSGLVTAAAAVSGISSLHFLLWTGIGKIPALMLESLVAFDTLHIDKNYFRLSVTLLLIGLTHGIFHLVMKKNRTGAKKNRG